MQTLRAAGKEIALWPGKEPDAPLVVLNTGEGEGQAVREALAGLRDRDFALAAVSVPDWDRELSPWPAPAAFRGGAPFAGGAEAYLKQLTGEILPAARAACGDPAWTGLAGYSLAGLFAVWALYGTDAFSRIASASGSMWYPDFLPYVRSHAPVRPPERVYLSLGDREARTRNPALATVEDSTRALAAHLRDAGIPCDFVLNPGNHFQEPELRMAKGIAALLA